MNEGETQPGPLGSAEPSPEPAPDTRTRFSDSPRVVADNGTWLRASVTRVLARAHRPRGGAGLSCGHARVRGSTLCYVASFYTLMRLKILGQNQ